MSTPLEAHRARNAEPAEIARLEELIAAHGVKYIYYQFVSINGRVLAKIVPAAHLRRNLEKGVQFHGTAIADLTSDRNGKLMGGGAQAEEFTILPDTDTFAVLPWDAEIGRFFCRGPNHQSSTCTVARFRASVTIRLRTGKFGLSWIGRKASR